MNRHSTSLPAAVLLLCLSAGNVCAQASLSTKALAGWHRWTRNIFPPFDDQYAESHTKNTGTDSATVSRTDYRQEELPPYIGQFVTYQALKANCNAAAGYGTLAVNTDFQYALGGYDFGDASATASYRDQFTVTAGNGAAPLELIADVEATWNTARPPQRAGSDSFGNPVGPGIVPGPLTSTWFYCFTNGGTVPVAGRLWMGNQLWYDDPPNPSGFYRFSVSLGGFTSGVPFEATLTANTGSSCRSNGNYTSSVEMKVTGYRVRDTATGADVPVVSLAAASGFAPLSGGPPVYSMELTWQGPVLTAWFQPGRQLNHMAGLEASMDMLTWEPVDTQWDGLWLSHQEPGTVRRFFRGTFTPTPIMTLGYRWVP